MFIRRLGIVLAVLASGMMAAQKSLAQTTNNNISAPNNAQSTANPNVDLNQNGSLVNTQVNNYPLGRSVLGNGVADCSSDGLAFSAFGNGVGPFDSGTIGGALTYTHSFGSDQCRKYAKVQLSKSKLETCLLLISNYSKMTKAGIDVSYQALRSLTGINCPNVTVGGVGGTRGTFSPQSSSQNTTNGSVFVPNQQPSSQQLATTAPAQGGQGGPVYEPQPQELFQEPAPPVQQQTTQQQPQPQTTQQQPQPQTETPVATQAPSQTPQETIRQALTPQQIPTQPPVQSASPSLHHSPASSSQNSPANHVRKPPSQGPVFIQY